MAIYNYPAILKFTLGIEKGYQASQDDPGNWSTGICGHGYLMGSNCGISAPTLIAWMAKQRPDSLPSMDPTTLMRGLRPNSEIVPTIYCEEYWKPISGPLLPDGLDLMLFDMAVNSGVSRAAKQIQDLVEAVVDGEIGPASIAAIDETIAKDGGILPLLWDLAASQGDYYRGLVDSSPSSQFAKGWFARLGKRLDAAVGLLPKG